MSFSERLAELQELFIGLGVAVAVLLAIAWLVSTLGGSNSQNGSKKDPSPDHEAPMQPGSAPRLVQPSRAPAVSALYITAGAGHPMKRIEHAIAVAGRGLVGDRYYSDKGHWSGTDECEVTIITQERIDEIWERWGVKVQNGEHRRNILISNLPIERLLGRRFHIGTALFGYERPRPPCAYITMISEPGMAKALGRDAGICVRCIKGGEIRQGDQIVISTITLAQALRYRARLLLSQWLNTGGGHD
ncbi:MAG: hypothetical protein GY948_09230 [Alphaproteobacteria bacterium]|nr:hypothetical protein [Alphaproteobacteria bacterium]